MATGFGSRGLRGPAYFRKLRGSATTRERRERHSILLVSDGVRPALDLIQQAIRSAHRQRANLYVLQALGCADAGADESTGLRDTFELGELLTAAVLRAGEGRLPPAVTIMIHVGEPAGVIDFVKSFIQPTLVIAEQGLVHGRSSALAELVGSAQDCPVLLIPTSSETADELPEVLRVSGTPGPLN